MKIIGMLFEDTERMMSQFKRHSDSYKAMPYIDAVINPKELTIVIGSEFMWRYITIADKQDVFKISGISFDTVFSEVTDLYCKNWILSRFRPQP